MAIFEAVELLLPGPVALLIELAHLTDSTEGLQNLLFAVQNWAGSGVFEVKVEPAFGPIALEIRSQKENRLAGDRVVEHHRREVGDHDIGGNIELGDIRIHRDIDCPACHFVLVNGMGVGVAAIDHGETGWQFDVLIHVVHRLPVAGGAAIVVSPGWRIHHDSFGRVGDSNFFTDALPLRRNSFTESIVARVSGFHNSAAIVERTRKNLGAKRRWRN